MVAAKCSAMSAAPKTASAPAARWAWGRYRGTLRWRSRRCSKSPRNKIRNPKLEIGNKFKWTKREIQNDTTWGLFRISEFEIRTLTNHARKMARRVER